MQKKLFWLLLRAAAAFLWLAFVGGILTFAVALLLRCLHAAWNLGWQIH